MEKILNQPKSEKGQAEKPIPSTPRLRDIEKTLELLRTEKNELGDETNWKELYTEVKPWSGGLQLSDNIRDVVRGYAARKIPKLKEAIASISDFDDDSLLEALSNNWFSEFVPEVEGQRREVLLAVAAHIIKRIETFVYQRTFENLSNEEFELKLGISGTLRQLLIDLLRTSRKSDPLFIRFLAFSRLSGKPPESASPTSIYVLGNDQPQTIASLWPKESSAISRNFAQIAENSQEWINEPGADAFKKYLQILSLQYQETDPLKADAYLKIAESGYEDLLSSQFPIIVVNGTTEGAYYKPPYIDPEIKVSISTADARGEELIWENARKGMVQCLDLLGVDQFADDIMKRPLRSVVAIGSHGVNLTFNAVAQEEPGITIFFNEQVRAYDRRFSQYIEMIANYETVFPAIKTPEGRAEIERMSRSNTVHHEFAHGIYPATAPESKYLGAALVDLDEIKAESLYRCFIPLMIENGSLPGTKEKWAVAMLASSCQILIDQPPGDPYYDATVFSLNKLFADGVVTFDGKQIVITDFDAFYRIQKDIADTILALYRDQAADEKQARSWIKKYCTPNQQLKPFEGFLKSDE